MIKKLSVISAFILSASITYAQTGQWSGSIQIQKQSLTLVFNLTEKSELTLDVPDQHAKGIKGTAERGSFGKIDIKIPAIAASFSGIWMGQQIVGTFTQNGIQLPLTLRPGIPMLNRPQTPVAPSPYTTEEVSFTNGDAVLKGTLTLPEGCDRSTPVLIMITGSGLQNRDEEIFEHKPFAVIADAFARSGIATLRYDDRGFGESTGNLSSATVEDVKNDASAGIKLLRERFSKVGIIGHSEGGTFALMLASEGKVDFVVSLAGMVKSTRETLLRQNREILSKSLPTAEVDEYIKLLESAFNALVSGRDIPSPRDVEISEALKANYVMAMKQLSTPYMKSSLALEPEKFLGNIKCPVLALNGTKDTQVDCESNLAALEKVLKINFVAARVSDVNHLFQHCNTGDVSEYKTIEETFSEDVIKIIIKWIKMQ